MTEIIPGSPFLRLPREIRNQIYRFLLRPRTSPTAFQKTFPIPILLANHQIHREASEIFYGTNTFTLEIDFCSPPIQNSLVRLAATRYSYLVRSYVLRIDLNSTGQPYPAAAWDRVRWYIRCACEVLAAGPVLRCLALNVSCSAPIEELEHVKNAFEHLVLLERRVNWVEIETDINFWGKAGGTEGDDRRHEEVNAEAQAQVETQLVEMTAILDGNELVWCPP